MPAPQVYAGIGSGSNNVTSKIGDKSVLSGPNWIPKLTDNLSDTTKRWYCLDLLGKYHTESKLKQFHGLTFYFRNTRTGNGAIITSMLPESLVYSIGGNYSNPIKLVGSEFVQTVANQFTNGNVSTTFNIDTALAWQSPKRMELVFRIPVFDDSATGTNINYQEAIDLFGEAILPEVSANGTYESVPGPNLFTTLTYRARNGKHTRASEFINNAKNLLSDKIKWAVGGEETLWDRISVQVGGLLLLDWCIIKDLKVTFPNTKAMVLHNYTGMHTDQVDDNGNETYKIHLQPLQAELEVTVATVMGITRATFKDMLYQTESTNSGYKEFEASNAKASKAKTNDSGASQTKSVKTVQDTVNAINNMVPPVQMSFLPGHEHDYDVIQYPANNMTPIYRAKEQQNMSSIYNLDNSNIWASI